MTEQPVVFDRISARALEIEQAIALLGERITEA
jgi:hypothetical protein